VQSLRALERKGDYPALIGELREKVADDPRTLADPFVKDWCGRRWRNLFIAEAAADPAAVKVAGRRLPRPGRDRRSAQQKVTERFLRAEARSEWELELPDPPEAALGRTTIVFAPGLIGSLLPLHAFLKAFRELSDERGWRFLRADCHPVRGCVANVDDLTAALERGEGLAPDSSPIPEDEAAPPGEVLMIGYSKGAPDALTLLAARPDLADRVRCLFSWAGAIGGSYLADGVYESIREMDIPPGIGDALKAVLLAIAPVVRLDRALRRLDEYDIKQAVRDLTTGEREEFLEENAERLDALDLPIFTITGSTSALEVPYFQIQGVLDLNRFDPENDMQLTQEQAQFDIPMSTQLAVLHANHWDMSYDPFPIHTRMGSPNLDHPFPKKAAVVAMVQLAAELGLVD
jgi:hypothetical protein